MQVDVCMKIYVSSSWGGGGVGKGGEADRKKTRESGRRVS